MKKGMTIVYAVKNGIYINLTNRCPCACTFCIRQNADGVYQSDPLWLEHEPSLEEVKEALSGVDMSRYDEAVFCGYGEPTQALDVLLPAAEFIKKTYALPVRVNTNGLANLIHGRDVVPLFKGKADTLSISLNSSNPEVYRKTVRPVFAEKAFPAMLSFAEEAVRYVPRVVMTTVSTTITPEDEAECARLCQRLGVTYRIRAYSG